MLVKIFVLTYNPQITKARIKLLYKSNITLNSGLSMLVGISETIRLLFFNNFYLFLFIHELFISNNKFKNSNLLIFIRKFSSTFSLLSNKKPNIKKFKEAKRFNQWLAGLIDGDGCFLLSKQGYASLEIVMQTRDKNCLYQIKNKFGGSIKLRSGVNYLRYRMHHKQGMLDMINAINGEIRNPIRLLQLEKICNKYNIKLIQPVPLTYDSSWLSGFFDSDGSIYLNLISSQLFITAGQKDKYLLDIIFNLYGGNIYFQNKSNSFKWMVYKKLEIIKLLDYFKLCPCKSAKNNRIKSIPRYFELRELKAHLAPDLSILNKAWKKFLLKWNKWEK
jgi:LAGLIDADG endonuclease